MTRLHPSHHVIRHFQLRGVRVIDKNIETFLRNVAVQSITRNVSIIDNVLEARRTFLLALSEINVV